MKFVRNTRRIRSFEPLEARQLLAADIVINEIMYHPADNRSSLEFIELYNRSDQTVSLQSWQFDNGVDFTFPPDAAIPAHGFLVVAADADQFASQYPDINNLVGGWSGRLANRGEVVRLVDDQGTVVDRIRYADEGEWASRFLGEPDLGFQGWKWRAPHDGDGPSLELQNAALPNEFGGNWHSSSVNGGTPGKVNSVAANQIPAITSQVSHAPPIPSSQDVVTVTVNVIDADAANAQVTVHFRNEQSLAFTSTTARPVSNSTSPHQTTFAASLPAFPNGTIVEFYFTVTDKDGNTSIDPALESNAADRTANYLYQVIDGAPTTQTWQADDQPIHYLIMRDSERLLLADIGDGPLAQAESNAQMNGTLIRIDGNGTDVRYLTGIRNRGGSSRIGPPNNYRINVPHDRPLDDAVSLNFNSRFTHAQVIGSAIFRLAGLTAAEAAPIQVRLNNLNLAEPGGPLMFGSYVSMEVVNGSFPDNHYPDDRRGNFYRAFAFGTKNASLEYLGPDAAPYAESYEKITNEEDNDWSDIIRLTQVLTDLPDQDFVAELEQTIHVDQWLRYLALDSLLGNLETGLNLGTGDNFWLYRGTVDSRFEIIPHDLDTILGRARVGEPNRSIFTYTNVPGLRRLLTHPDLVPRYYQAFLDLMDEVYNPETLHPLLDQLLGDWVPADELNEMKQFIVDRTAGVLAQIPQEFTITSQLDEVNGIARSTQPAVDLIGTANAVTTRSVTVNGQLADWSPFSREWSVRTTSQGETTTLIPFGSHWRFLDDGSNQGTRWRRSDFDDVPWRTGVAPLGYGEGDEATVVSFGSNSADKYVTTYFRHAFDVADVDKVRDLTLRLRRDDGAVVYLNGQEVVRSNMPGGDIDFQTVASSWIGGGLEGQTLSFAIDPSLLVANDNILAVEIHQRSPIDDDLRFDLELEASVRQIKAVSRCYRV
ncbi:MAG: CotH kinase family protein [Pirellulaceae bacterium]